MAKRKVIVKYLPETKNELLNKSLKQLNLKMVHPFLNKNYRPLKKSELKNKKVFVELFGDEEFKAWKLKAVYEYQLQD